MTAAMFAPSWKAPSEVAPSPNRATATASDALQPEAPGQPCRVRDVGRDRHADRRDVHLVGAPPAGRMAAPPLQDRRRRQPAQEPDRRLAVAREDPVAHARARAPRRPGSPRGPGRWRTCRSAPGGGRRPSARRTSGAGRASDGSRATRRRRARRAAGRARRRPRSRGSALPRRAPCCIPEVKQRFCFGVKRPLVAKLSQTAILRHSAGHVGSRQVRRRARPHGADVRGRDRAPDRGDRARRAAHRRAAPRTRALSPSSSASRSRRSARRSACSSCPASSRCGAGSRAGSSSPPTSSRRSRSSPP